MLDAAISRKSLSPGANVNCAPLVAGSAAAAGSTSSVSRYGGSWMDDPRLDWHLDNWARFMRVGGLDDLDTKMPSFWSSGASDFDTMADNAEAQQAEAFDALVVCLPIDERIAVHHVHLGAVWRMHRQRIEDVYERARLSLSDGMRRKGME